MTRLLPRPREGPIRGPTPPLKMNGPQTPAPAHRPGSFSRSRRAVPPMDEQPATYSVPVAAALLGMSKATLYRAINRGDIIAIRFGRAVQIPRHVVDRLISDGNQDQAAS